MLREGTIADATIINSPSSTNNQTRRRDPEMKQTQKGNQWYFGSQVMNDLLHGEETAVYGDKAYANTGKKEALNHEESSGMLIVKGGPGIRGHRKTVTGIVNRIGQEQKGTRLSSGQTSAGYRETRYKGVLKNATQVFCLFAIAKGVICPIQRKIPLRGDQRIISHQN